jgi:hypothetical protein
MRHTIPDGRELVERPRSVQHLARELRKCWEPFSIRARTAVMARSDGWKPMGSCRHDARGLPAPLEHHGPGSNLRPWADGPAATHRLPRRHRDRQERTRNHHAGAAPSRPPPAARAHQMSGLGRLVDTDLDTISAEPGATPRDQAERLRCVSAGQRMNPSASTTLDTYPGRFGSQWPNRLRGFGSPARTLLTCRIAESIANRRPSRHPLVGTQWTRSPTRGREARRTAGPRREGPDDSAWTMVARWRCRWDADAMSLKTERVRPRTPAPPPACGWFPAGWQRTGSKW